MSISATYGTPAIESIVVLEGEYEAAQERRAAEKWRADEADRRVSLLLQRLARISGGQDTLCRTE